MDELCTWPVSYEGCGVASAPVVDPVSLVFATGTVLALERDGDVVSAVLTSSGVPGDGSEVLALPTAFQPRGEGARSSYYNAPPTATLAINEQIASGAPGASFTGSMPGGATIVAEWLADPLAPGDSTGCSALDGLPDAQVAAFERMASEMLWNWTDRIFGVCEVSVRPCRSDCSSARRWMDTFWGRGPYPWGGMGAGSWVPLLIGGQWFNMGCGCAGTCTCREEGPNVLRLPGPIVEVSSVTINGEVVPPAEYEVLYGRNLVRLDGSPWPSCQNLLAPATAADTFEVIYTRGVAVPQGGQIAAGILACELAKAACGDATCQLPQRIQTATRQGITVGVVDSFRGLDNGRTGIWLIDSWTASVKAPTAKAGAGVRSPDFRPKRGGVASWR